MREAGFYASGCADEPDAGLANLANDVKYRVEASEGDPRPMFTCEGDRCFHEPLMEFDHSGEFRFVGSEDGPKLALIIHVAGGMTEAFYEDADRYVAEALASLSGSRCD